MLLYHCTFNFKMINFAFRYINLQETFVSTQFQVCCGWLCRLLLSLCRQMKKLASWTRAACLWDEFICKKVSLGFKSSSEISYSGSTYWLGKHWLTRSQCSAAFQPAMHYCYGVVPKGVRPHFGSPTSGTFNRHLSYPILGFFVMTNMLPSQNNWC